MIQQESKLVQAKHDLIRAGDDSFGDAIADLDHEIRQEIALRLANVEVKADVQREAIHSLPDTPSLRQQYKESIRIYRSLLGLVAEIRQVKKDIRIKLGLGGKE